MLSQALSNAKNEFERREILFKYAAAQKLRNEVIKNIDANFGGRTLDATAAFRGGASGGLRNSVQVDVRNDEPAVVVNATGNTPYWRIHEYGGVVKPVKKKWLTIPAADRYRAKRAREFRNLIFVKKNEKKAYLIDTINKRVAFFLRKKVVIPARPYIKPAVKKIQSEINSYDFFGGR